MRYAEARIEMAGRRGEAVGRTLQGTDALKTSLGRE
jgi:hypothetical protein